MADRSRADPERILVARLDGMAIHHARWRGLTEAEHATGVVALRELAAGRADLLAEVAGLVTGFSGGELNEPLMRQVAPCAVMPGLTRPRSRYVRRRGDLRR